MADRARLSRGLVRDDHNHRPAPGHLADQPDPTALTLRPRTSYVYAWTDGQGDRHATAQGIEQPPWWVRGVWFVFIGWWASAAVMLLGFGLVVLIVTLPLGLMLYNRVPFVGSLYRY